MNDTPPTPSPRAPAPPAAPESVPPVEALRPVAYLGVYGFNMAGLSGYTRMFGQVFSPSVTMVFVLKTLFFSLAVALIPMAAGLYDSGERAQPDSELGGLARMFAVLLLIETASLMGNYY